MNDRKTDPEIANFWGCSPQITAYLAKNTGMQLRTLAEQRDRVRPIVLVKLDAIHH